MLPEDDPYVVFVGDTLRLTCHVTDSNPSVISFEWLGRKEIDEFILIEDIHRSEAGVFSCRGINGINGSIEFNKTILVQRKCQVSHIYSTTKSRKLHSK